MSKPKTPREVLQMLFRRKVLFLLGASFFAIVVLLAAHWFPLKYTASMTFERTNDISAGRARGAASFEEIKPSMTLRLAGATTLSEALQRDEIGLTKGFPRNGDGSLTTEGRTRLDQLVRQVQPSVKVRMTTNSDLIDVVNIEFEHSEADVAEQLPLTLFNMFRDSTINELNERLEWAMAGLKKELNAERSKRDDASEKRARFDFLHVDSMPDNPNGLRDKLNKYNQELSRVERALKQQEELLAEIKDAAQASETTTQPGEEEPDATVWIPNPELVQLNEKLKRAKEGMNSFQLRRMTPNHPEYKELERVIEILEEQIANAPEKIVQSETYINKNKVQNPQHFEITKLENAVKWLTKEKTDLISNIDDTEKLASNSLKIRQEYLALCNEETKYKDSVERLERSLAGVETDLKAEIAKRRTTLKIIQQPQKQYLPSSPKLSLVLLVALLGGLGFGGALVFLANSMDRTIGTTDEAMRHFNLTLHGAVGEIATPRDRTWRWVKLWVITPVVIVVVVTVIGLASLDIVLRLKDPGKHTEWRKDKVSFVLREVGSLTNK